MTYIDDSLLKSDTFSECQDNILDTVKLVDDLGFTIHPEKSVLFPTQEIVFVGFLINSVTMTVRLTPEKVNDIIANCVEVINCKSITIRNLAKLIGKLVASEPAVQYAPLYYKSLEIEKACLQWWVDNIKSSSKPIIRPQPDIVIESDSSLTGWGAVNKSDFNMVSGLWSQDEKQYHINYLELKAAFLALQFFCQSMCSCILITQWQLNICQRWVDESTC